jgi:NADPH-dependent 2,4-dienoyl-CoA reductase/sulfur reductase-like enzyme
MSNAFDVVVVGAGPAGLAAACSAAEAGRRVCLVDDNAAPGGQIWRRSLASASSTPVARGASARWLRKIEGGGIALRSGWRALEAPAPGLLRIAQIGEVQDLGYASLILASGARELFLPFPGWTLPGVYGVGGLQAFVKSGFDIRGKRILLAGTGPLLIAVAAALKRAGGRVVGILEQAPRAKLTRFAARLLTGHPRKLLEGTGYLFATLGVPFHTGSWVTEARGDERVEQVSFTNGSRSTTVEVDFLASGFHLVANTELAELLGCALVDGVVEIEELQQTSVSGIYCVGELTGIGGVDKALIEGRIAGLAAAGKPNAARGLLRKRRRHVRFGERLSSTFALRSELKTPPRTDTIVCRCEDVTHGSLHALRGWREAKLHTRCGMGPCQGRICGAASAYLYGWQATHARPPVSPSPVGTLAERCEVPGQQHLENSSQ